MKNTHIQKILILDFGSQYTQLIARRVRELGVYCEIFPYDVESEYIREFQAQGIILSGGPATLTNDTTPRVPHIVFDLQCPVLGICYGMQAMATQLGGKVENAVQREFGHAEVRILTPTALLSGIEDRVNSEGEPCLNAWMSHGDHVIDVPTGFTVVASSDNAPIVAIADESRHYYGLQFHPEVTHTSQGKRILQHFVMNICQCEGSWIPANIIKDSIQAIQQKVGEERVILGISGGVDSTVTAALLHEAIGQNLIGIFVDTGLLRLGEAEEVENTLRKHLGIPLQCIDAREQFYQALSGVVDPEEKRKVIGKEFVTVFERAARDIPAAKWLAQGTIYPDVIESAGSKTGKAAVIKSHHNVGGLPEKMHLKLLEPLRELFKDEVRTVGLELGLPREMIFRHPFPGPGLGVRILGEVRQDYAEILRAADAIFIQELRRQGFYDKVSQAFAVFLPVKSVAVMGDARCYDYVIALRAVETTDFMTAHWAQLPHDFLGYVSNRIINEIAGISRVVYDISGKPPATIEWE